jgi:peptidoglycan/xylan/chitin deacetylase (PgdA/CDA1 family)
VCHLILMVRASAWGRPALVAVAFGATAMALARAAGAPLPGVALALGAAALVATVGVGVGWMPSGVFARPILGADPSRSTGRFALTFDDGPHPVHTRRVLDLLEARGHRGTFFVIGRRAEREAALLAEIARRGHGLGNHSFAHAWLMPCLPSGRIAADLERASELLARAAGRRPRWLRPPIGLVSPPVAAAARRARLELVGWSARARDGVAGASVERAAARLLGALGPGAILALHDAAERDDHEPIAAAILARVLDGAEARGLRSVTLDELLG